MFPASFEAFTTETIAAWYDLTERDTPAIWKAMRQWTYNEHSSGRNTAKRGVSD